MAAEGALCRQRGRLCRQTIFPFAAWEGGGVLGSNTRSSRPIDPIGMRISSNPKILLIDDSVADLRVLTEFLSARGLDIVVAFDGKDGYRKAQLLRPDLILLDVHMPGSDGFATCRLLKANPDTSAIPVIFLTAANQPQERLTGLTLGAVDYIAKPLIDEAEVVARVQIHLELARRLRAAAPAAPSAEVDTRPEAVLVKVATEHLRRDLRQPPSPEVLARLCGTNETRLNEAFHKIVGMPIYAWLREERLTQAQGLLGRTETPIADIGDHLGYTNAASFSKAVRERFGCSPRELRSRLRDEAGHRAPLQQGAADDAC